MITGSHNPPDYNGFKTVCGSGTLHGETIQDLRKLIERQDFESGAGTLGCADLVSPYVDEIASQFHFDRRVKLAADAGNGTAGPVFHRILEKLNVDATELFFEMEGVPKSSSGSNSASQSVPLDRKSSRDRCRTGDRV